jgi:hypothetical protein
VSTYSGALRWDSEHFPFALPERLRALGAVAVYQQKAAQSTRFTSKIREPLRDIPGARLRP